MNDTDVFLQHRPMLFGLAYRMLGSASDAEDVLQEAFLRWHRANETDDGEKREAVHSPKSYLSTIVARLCMDQLRSARARREVYVGEWLPEPLVDLHVAGPEENVELDETLSMAFLVLLESLSPEERAVFLLRQVFDYGYEEIARIVNKSEANCRQMVRRAQQHLAERRPRFDVTPEQQEQMTQRFVQACLGGDMQGLIGLLSDEIVLRSDGGGKVRAAHNAIFGPDKVARFILGIMGKVPEGTTAQLATVNGEPGIVTYEHGQPQSVWALHVRGGRIASINIVVNPDKLRHVPTPTEQEAQPHS